MQSYIKERLARSRFALPALGTSALSPSVRQRLGENKPKKVQGLNQKRFGRTLVALGCYQVLILPWCPTATGGVDEIDL